MKKKNVLALVKQLSQYLDVAKFNVKSRFFLNFRGQRAVVVAMPRLRFHVIVMNYLPFFERMNLLAASHIQL